MKPSLRDRSEFFPGPARKSPDKETERLTDIIDTKAPSGTISFEVTGAVPTFVGEVAGQQGFYVASVVEAGVVNMANTVLLEDGLGNLPLLEDTGNVFGIAAGAVVGKRDAANAAAIYDFANGSVSFLTHGATSNFGSYRIGSDFAVSTPYASTTTGTVVVVQNGTPSVVTLTAPAGHSWLQATGISTVAGHICSVWSSSDSTSSGTAVVALHSLTGTLISTSSSTSVPRAKAVACVVDSGRVAFVTPTAVFTAPASGATALSQVASSGTNSDLDVAINITADANLFMGVSNTLHRINLSTGLTSVWPEVFRRFAGSPAVLTASASVRSMYAVDANTLVYGSVRVDVTGSVNSPMYSVVVLDGVGANVSDSTFTAYTGTNTSSFAGVYAVTRLSNGNIVFALASSDGGRYLIQVSGP